MVTVDASLNEELLDQQSIVWRQAAVMVRQALHH